MVIVTGNATIRPKLREEAIQAALEVAEATRAEPGCITYRFSADLQDPYTIYIFEEWESEEALARHFQSEHLAAFRRKLPRILADTMTVKQYLIV